MVREFVDRLEARVDQFLEKRYSKKAFRTDYYGTVTIADLLKS